MTQYAKTKQISRKSPSNATAIYVGWHRSHQKMYICYSTNIITVVMEKPLDEVPDISVVDVTESYIYDPECSLLMNTLRHNHIVGEYSPNANSIYIFHKKHKYEINLPPQAKIIICGNCKITI